MSANHTNSVGSTQKRMLGDISVAENIYIACGYTDMRKSIDGLAAIILQQFKMDPFQSALFLFCGKRCNRIKALLWEKDGFVLLYKRLENGSFRWLMEGLAIEQKSSILPAKKGAFC